MIIILSLLLTSSLLLLAALRTTRKEPATGHGLGPAMAATLSQRDGTTCPDMPAAFGSGLAWIAISADDIADVRRALAISSARPCNWQTGIGALHTLTHGDSLVFISPPVAGWVMVAGRALPSPSEERHGETLTALMVHLARHFDHVQYFQAQPQTGDFAWVAYRDARLVRAFAFADGRAQWNRGHVTSDETEVAPHLFKLHRVSPAPAGVSGERARPSEALVLTLAGRWSIDPTTLGKSLSAAPDLGLLAHAPEQWASTHFNDAA